MRHVTALFYNRIAHLTMKQSVRQRQRRWRRVARLPEGVRGDELGPAVDDVEVALLAALGHRGQKLLELLVDDPNTNL